MNRYAEPLSSVIGNRIKNERLTRNMTQAQFAELLGISCSYLGAIERGTRPVSRTILARLHDNVQLSYDYIMEGKTSFQPSYNMVSEPERYRLRRDLNLLVDSCSQKEIRDCLILIGAYLGKLKHTSSDNSI